MRANTLEPWLLLLAGLAVSGCSPRPAPVPLAPPDVQHARAALAASLDLWKQGSRDPGGQTGAQPSVGTVDGQRVEVGLRDYKIVGPLAVSGPGRPFAVRLFLDSADEPLDTRYIVLGQDPLWVFGQADYDRILHWEHKMDDEEPASSDALDAPETQKAHHP